MCNRLFLCIIYPLRLLVKSFLSFSLIDSNTIDPTIIMKKPDVIENSILTLADEVIVTDIVETKFSTTIVNRKSELNLAYWWGFSSAREMLLIWMASRVNIADVMLDAVTIIAGSWPYVKSRSHAVMPRKVLTTLFGISRSSSLWSLLKRLYQKNIFLSSFFEITK